MLKKRYLCQIFDILPFVGIDLSDDDEQEATYTCVNYIPEIAPQLKRAASATAPTCH